MKMIALCLSPQPFLREHSSSPFALFHLNPPKLSFQHRQHKLSVSVSAKSQTYQSDLNVEAGPFMRTIKRFWENSQLIDLKKPPLCVSTLSLGAPSCLVFAQEADAGEIIKLNAIYETGELFELGIQLSYLLLLLALLGVGSFFVIRQVLVRRELDLSAKELQEQVRSGDASATELFELGAVMLRRKFYPAATKYLLQAIEKWDGDDQDLAQVYNALGVSYIRDGKTDKGIAQFEKAVKLQPGYVTAWNNLGDALEKNKDLSSALKAFEEVLLFDPNNKVARPRRDALKEKVTMYKGVPVKPKKR
ncbi:hypothetical protein SAY87_024649 [Trapa incisa]|uniref:Tetratricopeptide repeat domain-containing protein PYG7, chloroplastic n=1 Tax=Trapa incisa TaxID=236973 RepID=A0AAN7GD68_9MYRT|nr:hypothetical protein SAY87_024649 [Trapa incisa]